MQMVSEVMTRDVMFVSPQESLQRAAQMMDDLDVGALLVCDGERLVGMITDRDITVRSTSTGASPVEARVADAMSADVRWCFEDQPLDDVMREMSDTQVRRVPVVSHDEQHRLVGIVSLGDLAAKSSAGGQKQDVEQVVEKVSSPSRPDRPQQSADTGAGTAGGSPAAGAAAAGGTGLGTAASAGEMRTGGGSAAGVAGGMAGSAGSATAPGTDAGRKA